MGSQAHVPIPTSPLAVTPWDAKPRHLPWWVTRIAVSWILGASLSACTTSSPSLTPPLDPKDADLRLTEEPYQSQEAINQRMAIVIPYLERATGLRIAYVPAINYAHSHQMLRDGEVDVINIGVMGGYRLLHNNPGVQPLAVQKPSFRSVLIANQAALKHKNLSAQTSPPLAILRNQRVAFGSRSSGSSFMQPLLHLRDQQIELSALNGCVHEPNTNHLPQLVAEGGMVDFAFIPSFSGDPLHAVPAHLHEAITVVWASDHSRNDFMAAAVHPPTSTKYRHLQQLRMAFLKLSLSDPAQKRVLDTWGYHGFEQPTADFPGAMINKVAEAHGSAGGVSQCQQR